MKLKNVRYILPVLMLFVFLKIQAQDYQQAIKIIPFSGVAYKKLTGFEKGYEISFNKITHGYKLTGLRVYQEPAFPRKSDKWFVCYGFGSHVSLYESYSIYNPFRPFDPARRYSRSFVSCGLDGYVGLEYRFLKHPFTINIDYIPNFEFMGPDYFRVNNYINIGLAVVF